MYEKATRRLAWFAWFASQNCTFFLAITMATSQPTIPAFYTPESQAEVEFYILNLGRERPTPWRMRAHELDGLRRSKYREAVARTLESSGEVCVRREGNFMVLHTSPETKLSVAEFDDIINMPPPEKIMDDFYAPGTAACHMAKFRLRCQSERQARSSPLSKGDSGTTKGSQGGDRRLLSMTITPKETGRCG